MKKIFNSKMIVLLIALVVFLTGCGSAASNGKWQESFTGYWFILAELDEKGSEIDFTGNTRFNLSLSEDGNLSMYMERYNYAKKIWYEKQEALSGFTYSYNEETNELSVKKADKPTVIFKRATYNGSDVVEMFSEGLTEKTILTRTNPKPK